MKPIAKMASSVVIALLLASSTLVVSANPPTRSIPAIADTIKSERFAAWEIFLLETYELETKDPDPVLSIEIFDTNLDCVLAKNIRESELLFDNQLRQLIDKADLLMEMKDTKYYVLKH